VATIDEIKIVVKAETDSAIAKLSALDKVNKTNTQTGVGLAKSIAGYTTGYGLAVSAAQKLINSTATLVSTSIKLAAAQERVKMEFSVLTGSMAIGNKLFDDMNRLAAKTPLELENITAAGKQLLSVGVPVDEITEKLRMLGDVALGNPEKLDRLTLAFGQLRSKGVASMEQLNRFIEAGVPIMGELEKQTGKTGAEVFKMVSAGKIGFADVEKALVSLTSEGGLYNGMMQKVSETAEGKFSTAMDNTKMFLAEIGNKLLPVATAALDMYNGALDEMLSKGSEDQNIKELNRITESIAARQELIGKAKSVRERASLEMAQKEAIALRDALQTKIEMEKEVARVVAQRAEDERLLAESNERSAAATEARNKRNAAAQAMYDKALATLKDTEIAEQRMAEARGTFLDYQTLSNAAFTEAEKLIADSNGLITTSNKLYENIVSLAREWAISARQIDGSSENLVPRITAYSTAVGFAIEEEEGRLELIRQINDEITEQRKRQIELAETAMDGAMQMAEAFGSALVLGEEGWKAFGKAGLNAVAAVIEAFARQYAAMAIAEFFTPGMQASAAGHAAAAAGLFAASGVVKAIPMAEGGSGIVTKPTLFLAGEAGPEPFAFGGANNKRGMGGGVTIIQNIGGSVIAERQVQALALSGIAQADRGY